MTEYEGDALTAAAEAVLFTLGRSVEADRMAAALSVSEEKLTETMLKLQERYDREDSGLRLLRLDDSYQLCTKAEYYDALIQIASQPQKPVMTEVLLEVLSIVAYKQPVTRAEIERIRGVSADYTINRLIEYGLIEEAGRLDAPGRPLLFATTEEFLRQFGLSSVRELPEISESTLEAARENVYRSSGFAMEGQMELDLPLLKNEDEKEEPEGDTVTVEI